MSIILVFDRDDEERASIVDLLSSRGENWRIKEAPDVDAFLRILGSEVVELIVCEQAISEDSELLDRLRTEHGRVPLLVISDDDPERVNALLMGAASYVPRSAMARDLVVVANRLLTLAGCRRRHARLLDGLHATEVKFRVTDNDRGMIPVLCGYLVDGIEEFAIRGDARRIHVAVAIEEALTNGIVHGNLEVSSRLREGTSPAYEATIEERRRNPPYAHRVLTVVGRYSNDVATIEIRDEGPGFDPRAVADPTHPANLDRTHGRGLHLIRSFTDDVRFNEVGNAITLVFRRDESSPRCETEVSDDGCDAGAVLPG